MSTEIRLISEQEASLIDKNALSSKQMSLLFKKTPDKYVKTRPAKGGGTWKFVTGGYVNKTLNLMFGFNWSFEIEKFEVIGTQAIVLGKLTCISNEQKIVKMQFGRQDIKFKKGTEDYLDLGNDLKGASTDALKKCASMIGVASDIYNAEEFETLIIVENDEVEDKLSEIKDLFESKKSLLDEKMLKRVEQIISNKEVNAFDKTINYLKGL